MHIQIAQILIACCVIIVMLTMLLGPPLIRGEQYYWLRALIAKVLLMMMVIGFVVSVYTLIFANGAHHVRTGLLGLLACWLLFYYLLYFALVSREPRPDR